MRLFKKIIICALLVVLTDSFGQSGDYGFAQNFAVVLDVINWEDNTAMNDSVVKVMDQSGRVLESYKNARLKFSGGVAFTNKCLWTGMPSGNPYAKAPPEFTYAIYQSISCIDKKTGVAKDTFIEGLTAEVPSTISDNSGVIFGSSSKPIIVLALDNGTTKILDLQTIDPKIHLALKIPENYFHKNNSYYQVVGTGIEKSAIIKLDEISLKVQKIVYFDHGVRSLRVLNNKVYAVEFVPQSKGLAIHEFNLDLEAKQVITENLDCFKTITILGIIKNKYYILDRVRGELRTYDLITKKCTPISKVDPRIIWGAIKKDVIYFDRSAGQTSILVYNLKTKAWTEIPAGKSIDWVQ